MSAADKLFAFGVVVTAGVALFAIGVFLGWLLNHHPAIALRMVAAAGPALMATGYILRARHRRATA